RRVGTVGATHPARDHHRAEETEAQRQEVEETDDGRLLDAELQRFRSTEAPAEKDAAHGSKDWWQKYDETQTVLQLCSQRRAFCEHELAAFGYRSDGARIALVAYITRQFTNHLTGSDENPEKTQPCLQHRGTRNLDPRSIRAHIVPLLMDINWR